MTNQTRNALRDALLLAMPAALADTVTAVAILPDGCRASTTHVSPVSAHVVVRHGWTLDADLGWARVRG